MVNVVYDLSRLSTRALNATPNGIDWIDALLADHFLSAAGGPAHALLFGFRGPRLFEPGALPNPVPRLDRAWGRDLQVQQPAVPDWLAAALNGRGYAGGAERTGIAAIRREARRAGRVARSLQSYGFASGSEPSSAAPAGAVYLNAAHFPLEQPRHVAWLEQRRDIRPVFFIHDLLPVEQPDHFWGAEPARHARRLELLARRGAGAIVTSSVVADALRDRMKGLGRSDLPVHRAPPPIVPMFRATVPADPRLEGATYFVVCGTIEPRKNHLLLFEVWRRLVARRGPAAPKLLVVGKEGWLCGDIMAAMRDPMLRGSVIEARGLSTGAYRAALAQACALLSPSLAEGFGLPLAEALATGTPTIVSDIPSHREQGGLAPLYLDPTRSDDWLEAIDGFAQANSRDCGKARERAASHRPVDQAAYLEGLAGFLESLE